MLNRVKFTKVYKKFKSELKESRYVIQILLFGLTFVIYINNLSPSVYGGDSGDFIIAALTKGVPHPSGYPLYTMAAILFLKLPITATAAWKVGLASSFFASLTVSMMYLLLREMKIVKLLSFLTSLILAFTYTFWLYAEVVEVFSLHVLFILILIYLSVRLLNTKDIRYIYFLSFFSGLSLTNNLSIILLFPPIFLTAVVVLKRNLFKPATIIKCVAFALLGLFPYLYIPIAARANPAFNWGNAVNLENFLALILRLDFGWVNTKYEASKILITLKTYLLYWKLYINIFVPIFAIFGVIKLLIEKKIKLLTLLVISLILTGPFMVLYSRAELRSLAAVGIRERFYLPSFVILIIFIPLGLVYLKDTLQDKILIKKRLLEIIIYSVFAILPISLFLTNFPKINLRNIFIGDNLGMDVLDSASERGTILFSSDSFSFNSKYMQFANKYRVDVYIPGKYEGYKEFLNIAGMTESEIEKYALDNRNTIGLQAIFSLIAPMMKKRDVFTEWPYEIHDTEYGKLAIVPYGLLFKYVFVESGYPPKEEYLSEMSKLWDSFHLDDFLKHKSITKENLILAEIQKRYSQAAYSTAQYIKSKYDDEEAARQYLIKATELDPVKKF